MGRIIKKQFSKTAFFLHHDKPNDFVISSWQRSNSPLPLLILRLILAGIVTAVWLWSMLDEGSVSPYYFIYLTNWGLLLLTVTTWTSAVVSLSALCVRFPDCDYTPWWVQWYWLLYNIATPSAFLITIFYWSILFDEEPDLQSRGFWLDVCTHGVNSLVMLLEMLLSRVPSRFLHFYQPLGFGVWYVVFSGAYYGAGGTDENGNSYIYNVVDWSNPGPTLGVVVATTAGLLALHALIVCVSMARTSLSSSCVRRKGHDLPSV